MKYVSIINNIFKIKISEVNDFVVFGQNVSTGSCLGGLTHEFSNIHGCKVFNTPNSENALVGMGFGLMLSGTPSALFLKQQDFLLLGVDQLRNTHNYIRQNKPQTSFTIVNIVMDAGFEGIQSSLNNLFDFCAISGCHGYTISSKNEAEFIIDYSINNPGFRIISLSHRLFNTEILEFQENIFSSDKCISQYKKGSDLTVVCFNFSLPQGVKLIEQLNDIKISASLYNVTAAHLINYNSIINDAIKTGILLIIDDSKSTISISTYLEKESFKAGVKIVRSFKRLVTEESFRPNNEIFSLDLNSIINEIQTK